MTDNSVNISMGNIKCFKCDRYFTKEHNLNAHCLFDHGVLMPVCTTKVHFDEIERTDNMRKEYKKLQKRWNAGCRTFNRLCKIYKINTPLDVYIRIVRDYHRSNISKKDVSFFERMDNVYQKMWEIEREADERGILLIV